MTHHAAAHSMVMMMMMMMLIWVRLMCHIARMQLVNVRPISPGSPDLLAAAPSAIIYNPFISTECVSCRL